MSDYQPSCSDCRLHIQRIAELESGRPVHMYVWSLKPSWICVVQAPSVAVARQLALEQIQGDDSTPERQRAAKWITENTPHIWHGSNAEFELTDSSELIEIAAWLEKKERTIAELQEELLTSAQAMNAENDRHIERIVELERLLTFKSKQFSPMATEISIRARYDSGEYRNREDFGEIGIQTAEGAIDYLIALIDSDRQRANVVEAQLLQKEAELQHSEDHRTELRCFLLKAEAELYLPENQRILEIRRLEAELQKANAPTGPIVDVCDLKADECGCNVVMRRYSNPFHRAYYKVSRCEFHETVAAEHRTLRQELAARDEEILVLKSNVDALRDNDEFHAESWKQQLAARDEEVKALKEKLANSCTLDAEGWHHLPTCPNPFNFDGCPCHDIAATGKILDRAWKTNATLKAALAVAEEALTGIYELLNNAYGNSTFHGKGARIAREALAKIKELRGGK